MKCSTPEQKLAIAQFERGKPYSDLEFEYQELHRLPQPDDVLQEFELPSGVNLVARNEDKGEKHSLLEWFIESTYLLLGDEYYFYSISSCIGRVQAYLMPAHQIRMLRRAFQYRFT